MLYADYFADDRLHDDVVFRRRFRMEVVYEIVLDVESTINECLYPNYRIMAHNAIHGRS
jgi:hypothetical protein